MFTNVNPLHIDIQLINTNIHVIGTGKTICLISLISSYQYQYPQTGKLIYCTRTVPEMTKCMEEIKRCIEYRTKQLGEDGGKILACCLSSRRNMCIHSKVMEEGDRETVDSLCRSMTASWVRSKVQENGRESNANLCEYYENYEKDGVNGGKLIVGISLNLYVTFRLCILFFNFYHLV